MTVGQPKYDDDQRRAIEHARLSRGLPASAIVALAREGELPKLDGAPLEAFEIKLHTVYSIAREANRRASRVRSSALVRQPREEAMSALWDRMMEIADRETQRLVDRSRRKPNEPVDAEHLRKMARFQRELAALPAPGERGKAPGTVAGGQRTEHPTKDKAAQAIFKAAAGPGIEPAQADPPTQEHAGETARVYGTGTTENGEQQQPRQQAAHGAGNQQTAAARQQADGQGEQDDPGSRARAAIDSLLVQSVTSPE
jgi:hypothetical protein